MTQKVAASSALIATILSVSSLFASCVTVHVNFPEGAVQKAADDYVNELYKARESDKKEMESQGASRWQPNLLPLWAQLLVSSAHADDFKVNSPKAKSILDKQKKRLSKILRYKKMGVLGESDDGLLAIKDIGKVKNKGEKTRVKMLVKNENSDRDDLYKEIVASNGLAADTEKRIRKVFFSKFKDHDPAGSMYRQGGTWKTK